MSSPPPRQFYESVKSTIDYLGNLIAAEVEAQHPELIAMQAMTLDAATGVKEVMASEEPAIVWRLHSYQATPVDPLYQLILMIGPKTTNDVSAELLSDIIGIVHNQLPERSIFEIKNYSGETVSEGPGETGRGFVQSVNIQEVSYDNQSTLRMAVVSVAVSRDV